MHLQIIVPFMQLTWKEATETYSVETVIPIDARYHLVRENSQLTSNGQEMELTFYLSEGFTLNPDYQGIAHVMRKFDFGGFPPPDGAGDLTASVTVIVYNEPLEANPEEPQYVKKSKMRLAEAEAGVDPVVKY